MAKLINKQQKILLGLMLVSLIGGLAICDLNAQEIQMEEDVLLEEKVNTQEFIFDEEAEAVMKSIVEKNKENLPDLTVQILFINDDGSRMVCSYGPYHDYCQSMNGDLIIDDYSNLSVMPMSEYVDHVPPVEMIHGGFSEEQSNLSDENSGLDEENSGYLESNLGGATTSASNLVAPPVCKDACIKLTQHTKLYSSDPHTIMMAAKNALEKLQNDLAQARLNSADECWGKGCGWKGTTNTHSLSVEPYSTIPFTCSSPPDGPLGECDNYDIKEEFTITALDWKLGVINGEYKAKGNSKPDPDRPQCYFLDAMVCEKRLERKLTSKFINLCLDKDKDCYAKIDAENPEMDCWNKPNSSDLGIKCTAKGEMCCTNTPNPVNIALVSITASGTSCYRCSDDPDFVARYGGTQTQSGH